MIEQLVLVQSWVYLIAWFLIGFKTYQVSSETIETEAVSRHKSVMNETLIFTKIVPLSASTLIPVSFPLVKVPLKIYFLSGVMLHLRIPSSCVTVFLYVLISIILLKSIFILGKKKNHRIPGLVSIDIAALIQSSVSRTIIPFKSYRD